MLHVKTVHTVCTCTINAFCEKNLVLHHSICAMSKWNGGNNWSGTLAF